MKTQQKIKEHRKDKPSYKYFKKYIKKIKISVKPEVKQKMFGETIVKFDF